MSRKPAQQKLEVNRHTTQQPRFGELLADSIISLGLVRIVLTM